VGDAAHAMTPDIGQGACQALESAVALGEHLRGAPDLVAALRAYEEKRFHRTADVNRLSWIVAETSGVANPLLCRARDIAMRAGLRAAAVSQLDWLLGGAS
jgi:2-polyprenyl-6-methoxyphenol hydroxylase-like FAD-dependent oxidoreductase